MKIMKTILANGQPVTLTEESPTLYGYPAKIVSSLGNLAGCNLEQANARLRNGTATAEEGVAYVEMWNRPGMRGTVARIAEYSIPLGDAGRMMIPEIRISEPRD